MLAFYKFTHYKMHNPLFCYYKTRKPLWDIAHTLIHAKSAIPCAAITKQGSPYQILHIASFIGNQQYLCCCSKTRKPLWDIAHSLLHMKTATTSAVITKRLNPCDRLIHYIMSNTLFLNNKNQRQQLKIVILRLLNAIKAFVFTLGNQFLTVRRWYDIR